MSQNESFIEEVTEEVRRDRLFGLMRRYGWIAILVVLLIVGGAAWNEWRKAQDAQQAQALGDALLDALEADDSGARVTNLQAIEPSTQGGQIVTRFTTVSEMIAAGDEEGATAILDAISGDGAVDPVYRQLAGFKSLLLQSDTLSVEDRRVGFEGIAQTSGMLRLPAEEQLALIEIETGETGAAITRLQRLQTDPEVTAGLRQRASQLIVALGGAPEAAPAQAADEMTKTDDN